MFPAYSLGQFVAEPFRGRLSDRIGRKPVLMITIPANAAGYLALAFVPNIWLAIAVRLFTGLGAGNVSTAQGYVADVTPPELRAGRMGLIGAAFGLGLIFGPAIGGLLTRPDLGPLGYQLPIFTASSLCGLAAIGVAVLLKESRVKADPATPRPAFLGGVQDAVANPMVSRVLLVTLIYMAGFSGMESTFGFWTEARYHWTTREVGLCFMIVAPKQVTTRRGLFAATATPGCGRYGFVPR
jgi:DHA1 family tetracycline resistance protein-like MFS transporter